MSTDLSLFMENFMFCDTESRGSPTISGFWTTVSRFSNRYTTLREIGKLGFVVGTVSTTASIVFNYDLTFLVSFTAISGFTWLCCDKIAQDLESQAQAILEHLKTSQREKGQISIMVEPPNLLTPVMVPSLGTLNAFTATKELMQGRLWPLIEMTLCNGKSQYKALGSFRVFLLGKIVISTDEEQNKVILQYPRYGKNVQGGHGWNTFARTCFGWENLIMAEGKKHQKLIQTLGPLFKQPVIKNRYFNDLKAVTQTTVSEWAREKEGICLLNAALEHSCKSVTSCFLGKQAAESQEIVKAVQSLMSLFWDIAQLKPMAIVNQTSRKIFARTLGDPDRYWHNHDVLENAIKKARRSPKKGCKLALEDNFISRLLDEHFTTQELIDNIKMLYFAGTETTGSLITTILGHLAANEVEQKKLLAELHEANVEKIEDLDYDKLHNLKRLDAVLYESLRLVPPIPAQVRKIQTDFGKYSYFIDHFHRLRDCNLVGENPEQFNPDRILNNPSLRLEINKTFGGGLTPCLGKHFAITETLLLITSIILQGHFELLEGDPSEVIMEAGAHLSPNLKIRFKED